MVLGDLNFSYLDIFDLMHKIESNQNKLLV